MPTAFAVRLGRPYVAVHTVVPVCLTALRDALFFYRKHNLVRV